MSTSTSKGAASVLSLPERKDSVIAGNPQDIKEQIAVRFAEIMRLLGLDVDHDPSLTNTPMRVAKMYYDELCAGLRAENEPEISVFPNTRYDQMLVEKDITLISMCEHHFVPIVGKCHIAYFPGKEVIGLSKFHRIVNYFGARPQVQERLTEDISEFLRTTLKTEDVAVIIDAKHMCCGIRGVKDLNSSTVTHSFHGRFRTELAIRAELTMAIQMRV